MRHVLFVCGKNRRRSPTAEAIFSNMSGIEVSSAGTASDSNCPLSGDLIDWADDIVVMEPKQARQIRLRFARLLRGKRIVNLDIPDRFGLMQAELVDELKAKATRWL